MLLDSALGCKVVPRIDKYTHVHESDLTQVIVTHVRRYTRNLVDAGNGKFNLMILCWGEGHGSAIHDHADAHCFMKMLKGELCEVRYAWPDGLEPASSATGPENSVAHIGGGGEACDATERECDGDELQELSRSTMETDGVFYINGE